MTLTLTQIVVLALVGLVGWLGAKWLFQQNTAKDERRRGALQLAATLQMYGLKRLPEILMDYAVGDYIALAKHVRSMAELATAGEDVLLREFDGIFDRVLEAKLFTPEGRALLAARLLDTSDPDDPETVYEASHD